MTIKEVNQKIASIQLKVEALRRERDVLVRKRYEELFNINTWHMLKAEYVYSTIAKESGLSVALIKKIIRNV